MQRCFLACAVEIHMDMSEELFCAEILMNRMHRPRPSFCASLRSRNAQEPFCAEIYKENAVRFGRDTRFVRACAIDMSQEKFTGNWPGTDTTTSIQHRALTPAVRTLGADTLLWELEKKRRLCHLPVAYSDSSPVWQSPALLTELLSYWSTNATGQHSTDPTADHHHHHHHHHHHCCCCDPATATPTAITQLQRQEDETLKSTKTEATTYYYILLHTTTYYYILLQTTTDYYRLLHTVLLHTTT